LQRLATAQQQPMQRLPTERLIAVASATVGVVLQINKNLLINQIPDIFAVTSSTTYLTSSNNF
jgi:hypothetical protein